MLVPGMLMARDIVSSNRTTILRKGVLLNARLIEQLRTQGYQGAYISDVFSGEAKIVEPIDLELFAEGLNCVRQNNVNEIVKVAGKIVDSMLKKDYYDLGLLDLRSTEEYTYHHSVNVAIYSVAIGRKMNLHPDDLKVVATAALAHDLGKSMISPQILMKPGRLTDDEYNQIKHHPILSNEIIRKAGFAQAYVLQAVVCHHENEDGSGYPGGLAGDEIPLAAKIIHVADVYDALTNRRAYKDAYAPINALEYLLGGVDTLFDGAVVEAAVEIIPAYPAGVDVILSTGQKALVLGTTEDTMRPIIKIVETGETVNLFTEEEFANMWIEATALVSSDYVGEIEVLNENRGKARETKKHIMIIDNDKMSQIFIKKALGDAFDYSIFTTGIEASQAIQAGSEPDLIISEIELPMLNGIEACKKIKQNLTSRIPYVFTSKLVDIKTIMQCKQVGAADFIAKPADPAYIKKHILDVIEKFK